MVPDNFSVILILSFLFFVGLIFFQSEFGYYARLHMEINLISFPQIQFRLCEVIIKKLMIVSDELDICFFLIVFHFFELKAKLKLPIKTLGNTSCRVT